MIKLNSLQIIEEIINTSFDILLNKKYYRDQNV